MDDGLERRCPKPVIAIVTIITRGCSPPPLMENGTECSLLFGHGLWSLVFTDTDPICSLFRSSRKQFPSAHSGLAAVLGTGNQG